MPSTSSMWEASRQYKEAVAASGQTLLDAANDLWTMASKNPDENDAVRYYANRFDSAATIEDVAAWCEASLFSFDFAEARARVACFYKGSEGKVLAAHIVGIIAGDPHVESSVLKRMLLAETDLYLLHARSREK